MADRWQDLQPSIAKVLVGEVVHLSNQHTYVIRGDATLECYFESTLSPVYDERGEVAGILEKRSDTTARVLGERRLSALEQVCDQLATVQHLDDLRPALLQSLSGAQSDLPCVLLYLSQRDALGFRLHVACCDDSQALAARTLDIDALAGALPRGLRTGAAADVVEIVSWSVLGLPGIEVAVGSSRAPVRQAAIVVLRSPSAEPLGLLVAGLSPQLAPDGEYLQFLRLLGWHVASAVARCSQYALPNHGNVSDANSVQRAAVPARQSQWSLPLDATWLDRAARAAGIGLFDIDIEGAIFQASSELLRWVGVLEVDRLQSISAWSTLVFHEDIRRVVEAIQRALRSREPRIELELRLNTTALTPRWVRAIADIAYRADGTPVRALGGVVDTHRLKEAAKARDTALQNAEKLSHAKDEFFATISHELRTPLHAIVGWSRVLQDREYDRAHFARGLSIIERNALAQARLVDDLLDMSRIISGKLRIAPVSFQLSSALHSALDVLRPAAEAKGIELRALIATEPIRIIADPDRMQQVIWNLLSNAIRFTPRDGVVSLMAQRSADSARITVSDTGQGISASDLPLIFDRYRQAGHFPASSYQGLGLGLAIVRHLVQAHGGTVEAGSDGQGKGARFTVVLPLPSSDDAASRGDLKNADASKSPAPMNALQGVRALIVDDDSDSLELLVTVLGRAGATTTSAPSAAAALNAAGQFDIIISDIGMPEIDGYELLKRLRAIDRHRDVPALALTGFATQRDALLARAAGYHAHVTKPVNFGSLISLIVEVTRPRG